MNRIAGLGFALPIFLLIASCASSPNWSGAETEAGAFVWFPSPGLRLWVNVALLGGILTYFVYALVQSIMNREKSEGLGCLSFVLLLTGFLLYVNIRDFIWHESYSIMKNGIKHSYYTNVWKTARKTDVLGWNDVTYIGYSPETTLDSTTWVKVYRSTGKRVYPEGGGQTEEGTKGRVLHFYGNEISIKFILDKSYFDTSRPEFLGRVWGWIFGSEDYKVSPREEARLRVEINRFMPETLREKMSPEARAYFLTRQAG